MAVEFNPTMNQFVNWANQDGIGKALNADSGHLHGHGYLRLGNEVMLEASDL